MAKILIVEDDQTIRDAYSTVLLAEGFDVEIAVDGEDGLEKIVSFEPDLILLDIMMPKLDGMDMLSQLRGTATGAALKVIVLTNMDDPENATKAYKLGVNDFAVKAEKTPKEVVERIRSILAE